MQLFKRLFISVHGSVEEVVARLQNHDALVRSSLRELEVRIQGAHSSFAALTRNLKKIEQEIEQATEDEMTWTRRAAESGKAGQREKAMECLKRARRAKQTIVALTKQRKASQLSHGKLQNAIAELQNMQKTLALKHSELNAREKAQLVSSSPFALSVDNTEEVLARWEDTLGGTNVEAAVEEDFASAFDREEENVELEAELNVLIGK